MNQKRRTSYFFLLLMLVVAFARVGYGQEELKSAPKSKPGVTITSLSPSNALTGSPALTLTVLGANFAKGSLVQLNGNTRASTLISGTQIQTQLTQADLASAGTIAVTVITAKGAVSNSLNFTVTAPPPSISSLSPNTAVGGSQALTLTVQGANFAQGSVVQLNGTPRLTTFISSAQLQTQLGQTDLASAGIIAVTVVNSNGALSNSVNFTVTAPPPPPGVSTISPLGTPFGSAPITPSTLSAFTLTVNGSSFTSDSKVQVNGSDRATTFVNNGRLRTQLLQADLASIGSLAITVHNANGSSNSATFTVTDNKIVYQSLRALDGSNAIITSPDPADPIVGDAINIWIASASATGSFASNPLTTFEHTSNTSPVWSPDGTKVLFVSDRDFTSTDPDTRFSCNFCSILNIFVMNADGTGITLLTKNHLGPVINIEPVWSPDGTKIAFVSNRAFDGSDAVNPNGTFNLWIMNADGTGPTPLTKLTASGTFAAHPAFSPDSTTIAYHSSRALDGSDNANLTADGSFIINNVWVVNPDGTASKPLTNDIQAGSDSFDPAWSPDGSKIAFDSQQGPGGSAFGVSNIWAMNPDGSNPTPLTLLAAVGADSTHPIWSPDGTKLAFQSKRSLSGSDAVNGPNGTNNIWVVNSDGSAPTPETNITALGANSLDPIWHGTGTGIFYDSGRAVDGSDNVNLTLPPTDHAPGSSVKNIWFANTTFFGSVPITALTADQLFITGLITADSTNASGVGSPNDYSFDH